MEVNISVENLSAFGIAELVYRCAHCDTRVSQISATLYHPISSKHSCPFAGKEYAAPTLTAKELP